jgi:ATP synthase protein I
MAVCVMIGIFSGSFLDKLFGTSPWLLFVFAIFGAGAAIKVLLDTAKKAL